jgi:hypothetical protein
MKAYEFGCGKNDRTRLELVTLMRYSLNTKGLLKELNATELKLLSRVNSLAEREKREELGVKFP